MGSNWEKIISKVMVIRIDPLAAPDSVPSTSSPTFLSAANDDKHCSEPIVKLLEMIGDRKHPMKCICIQKAIMLQYGKLILTEWRDSG
jgi:hypothetical protein